MWQKSPRFKGLWRAFGEVHFCRILAIGAIIERIFYTLKSDGFTGFSGYRYGKRSPIWAYFPQGTYLPDSRPLRRGFIGS